MRSVTALRRWLLFVGLLRLFSGAHLDTFLQTLAPQSIMVLTRSIVHIAVVLGYGYPSRIQTNVYNAQPEQGKIPILAAPMLPKASYFSIISRFPTYDPQSQICKLERLPLGR